MTKGHDEHAYYLKELMRLLPTAYKEARKVFADECELRELGYVDKADRFREVKCAMYLFAFDCRVRNGELIKRAVLNRKERKFLRLRYVRSWSWRELYNSQGYSPDHCKRIHRDAVAKVARQNANVEFKTLYERERKRFDELLRRVGEK